MKSLLFADLYDVLRFKGFIASAAFGVKELQQFLQGFGVGGVTKECALPFHGHEVLGA
jgi:hypothetical protein